jgi:putative flippase GtrA
LISDLKRKGKKSLFKDTKSFLTSFFGRESLGKYSLIGISGVTLDAISYSILIVLSLHPILATVIGTILGISNNYILNSHFNFFESLSFSKGLRFLTVGVIGLIVSVGLLHFTLIAGMNPIQGKLLTIPFVVSGQFIANKYWTFKPKLK